MTAFLKLNLNKAKRTIEKVKKATDDSHRALWEYSEMIKSKDLDDSLILIEPQQGRSLNGNMFYILKELTENPAYAEKKITLVANSSNLTRFEKILKNREFNRVRVVVRNSRDYYEALSTAKHLITDTSFPPCYRKKDGQIIWNTWHGTPLKALGRSDKGSPHDIGNVQRNFVVADYLSYPNEYTMRHMVDDYMIGGLSSAKVLLAGYPRNTVFFNGETPKKVVELLDLHGKRLYAYMPTWRQTPTGGSSSRATSELLTYLFQIDDRLEEDEVLFVSVHPLARGRINFRQLKHVRPFPEQFETYEVLAACDVLITDYSSVLFDFVSTGRKIVLFDYDADLYLRDRGMYIDIDELPFPHAREVLSLLKEVRSAKAYDDSEFVKKYCPYDSAEETKKLCERVVLGYEGNIEERSLCSGNKKKALIYTGNLSKNGITASLTSLLSNLNTEHYDYYLTFRSSHVAPNKEYLSKLREDIFYIPLVGKANFSPKEKAVQYLYEKKKIDFDSFDKILSAAYKEDIKRLYSGVEFDTVVQFSGYDYKMIYLFSKFASNKIIFAHSDMLRESKVRGNSRLDLLGYSYREYDKVAVVSRGLSSSVDTIAGHGATVHFAPNLFDYKRVQEMAKADFSFDISTESNRTFDQITEMLNSSRVIVSIGRFSPEKQHLLLLDAFDKVADEHEDISLLILGGSSWRNYYKQTCVRAQEIRHSDRVALVKGLSNPYALLNRANALILSSEYEGFGLVLLEAIALGKPVVSTDIDGPRDFMNQHGGYLVENTEEGLVDGLRWLAGPRAKPLDVDLEAYNVGALARFESLFSSE